MDGAEIYLERQYAQFLAMQGHRLRNLEGARTDAAVGALRRLPGPPRRRIAFFVRIAGDAQAPVVVKLCLQHARCVLQGFQYAARRVCVVEGEAGCGVSGQHAGHCMAVRFQGHGADHHITDDQQGGDQAYCNAERDEVRPPQGVTE